jgi:chromosome segregation ATPase
MADTAAHCNEQERELQLNRNYAEGLKAEVEQSQALIRELQERIQSDDRVSELEALLQNVQNRASELEFQLSRSKQVCRWLSFECRRLTFRGGAGQCFTQGQP